MKKQSAVNYRTGDENQSCSKCSFFQPPESCTQVEGIVSAGGLCDLYTPKPDAGAGAGAPDAAALESMLFGGGLM